MQIMRKLASQESNTKHTFAKERRCSPPVELSDAIMKIVCSRNFLRPYKKKKERRRKTGIRDANLRCSQCIASLGKDETETRFEERQLRNPASHKPKKKDDISQEKGIRHRESCESVR